MCNNADRYEVGSAVVVLLQGDITKQDTHATVNAANSTLLGGGGVDGAIHRAGGPSVLHECKKIVARIGRCDTGEAVITTAGDMRALHVIHTVGPVYRDGRGGEPDLLANAYRNSLSLAVEKSLKTISFPSISTGAYRYPLEEASRIALKTIFTFLKEQGGLEEVRMVLFSQPDLDAYRESAAEVYEEVVGS